MKSDDKNLIGAIEAILFVYGEPLELKRIAKILQRDPKLRMHPNEPNKSEQEIEEIIRKSLEELHQKYLEEDRGLRLIFQGDKVQLATKKEFTPLLENFIKEEFKENLTPASLETLSLTAYLGPVSRSEIDYYRGVNSSFILRSLLLRGLIDRFPDPQRGNIFLYQPSFDLLKYLGLSKVEELPDYEKYSHLGPSDTTNSNDVQNPNDKIPIPNKISND